MSSETGLREDITGFWYGSSDIQYASKKTLTTAKKGMSRIQNWL
jgi:hypothetical protein